MTHSFSQFSTFLLKTGVYKIHSAHLPHLNGHFQKDFFFSEMLFLVVGTMLVSVSKRDIGFIDLSIKACQQNTWTVIGQATDCANVFRLGACSVNCLSFLSNLFLVQCK